MGLGLFSKSHLIYENTVAFDTPCFCKIFKMLKKLFFSPKFHETRNVCCILTCIYFNWCAPKVLAETILYCFWWNWTLFLIISWIRNAKMTRRRNQHGCSKVNSVWKVLDWLKGWSRWFRDYCHLETIRSFDSEYPPCNLSPSHKGPKAFGTRRFHRHSLRSTSHIWNQSTISHKSSIPNGRWLWASPLHPVHRADYLHPT